MRQFAFLALPILALAACSPAPTEDAEAPADTVETEGDAAAPLEEATLDLQATGIVIPAQNGFEQLEAPFGSSRAATEATLANVVGASTSTFDASAGESDCWLDTTAYEGITLAFSDDSFVGYFASTPYVPELTRAEMLEDPGVAMVEGSSLGDEFTIGTGEAIISGLFTGAEDDATVDALWAGENCIFR